MFSQIHDTDTTSKVPVHVYYAACILIFGYHFQDQPRCCLLFYIIYVFLLVFLSAPPLPPPMLEIHDAIDTDMENIEICNIEISSSLIVF